MIVDKPLIAQILTGSKTQHRIPVTRTNTTTAGGNTACTYRTGRTYAVQPRHDKPATCRIVIQNITRHPLDEITDQDAQHEGFTSVGKFLEHWTTTHPNANPIADVWALSFVLDRADTVTLMHRRSERGYTSDPRLAVPREPEAVDPTWLDKFAAEAEDKDRARQLDRPLAWRLQQALKDAEALGVDIPTRQLLAIEQRIRSIELRTRQRRAA